MNTRCSLWVEGGHLHNVRPMSAFPPKADVAQHDRDVRFVPKADSCTAAKIIKLCLHHEGQIDARWCWSIAAIGYPC